MSPTCWRNPAGRCFSDSRSERRFRHRGEHGRGGGVVSGCCPRAVRSRVDQPEARLHPQAELVGIGLDERVQSVDPELDVGALQASDCGVILRRKVHDISIVHADHVGVAEANSTWKATSAWMRSSGVDPSAATRVPPETRSSLTLILSLIHI